ncbi:hypothetical protein BH10PSE13_BH10PSE13_15380 [soil metagenome]
MPGDVWTPLGIGLLYAVLAAATIRLTSAETSVSVLWPANAVPMAMIMLRPRRQWGGIILATFFGSVTGTFLTRGVSIVPVLLGAANALEILLAGLLTNFPRIQAGVAGNARTMVRFFAASGVIAPAISAVLGGATFNWFFGQSFVDAYLVWFFSDSLGILIFTPFFHVLLAGKYRRAWHEASVARRWEAGLLLLLTSVVAIIVFEAHRPLLFLVIMPTMLVSFRLGWMGVKVAVMLIAVIGTACTMAGHGPLITLTQDPQLRAHYLQMFLVAQLLTQWPVVAALTARDRLMQQLASSERSLRFLAAQSTVLMLTFDVAGVCRKAVGASQLLPGRLVEEMPGLLVDNLTTDAERLLRPAHELALDIPDRVHSVEFRVGKGNEAHWLEATFRALEDEKGRCPGTVMTLHDISVRKHETIELVRFAHTDSLTGLLNRAGFMVRLKRALVGAPAGALSLAMIDVDRFKLVNDNCGHQTGDLVLAEIARRIAGELRASDSVARMGGDEFVVLLDTADPDDARDVCARLVRVIAAEPVRVNGNMSIGTAISCGVANYRGGLTAEQFLHDADVALYEAKRGGRNRMVAA